MNETVWVCTVYDGNSTWPCHVFRSKAEAENWKAGSEFKESHRMFPDKYEIEEFNVE